MKMKAENASLHKKNIKKNDDDRGEKAQFVPTRLSRP